jgi:hypothetical protein
MDDLVKRTMARVDALFPVHEYSVRTPPAIQDRASRIEIERGLASQPTRPRLSVNKNFLQRTVNGLETENRMVREDQMWSQRRADRKHDAMSSSRSELSGAAAESSAARESVHAHARAIMAADKAVTMNTTEDASMLVSSGVSAGVAHRDDAEIAHSTNSTKNEVDSTRKNRRHSKKSHHKHESRRSSSHRRHRSSTSHRRSRSRSRSRSKRSSSRDGDNSSSCGSQRGHHHGTKSNSRSR